MELRGAAMMAATGAREVACAVVLVDWAARLVAGSARLAHRGRRREGQRLFAWHRRRVFAQPGRRGVRAARVGSAARAESVGDGEATLHPSGVLCGGHVAPSGEVDLLEVIGDATAQLGRRDSGEAPKEVQVLEARQLGP